MFRFITIPLIMVAALTVGAPLLHAQPIPPQSAVEATQPPASADDFVIRAPAQPAANDNEPSAWSSMIQQIRDGIVATVAAALLAFVTLFLNKVGAWVGMKTQIDDVARDLKMAEYAKTAIGVAIDYALKKVGASPEDLHDPKFKSAILETASKFITMQFPEIWKWLDQNQDGVIDYIAAHLPTQPAKAA